MSDSTMFDTHRHVKELAGHGLSEACAESIVKVVQDGFTHNVATKSALSDFRAGIQEQFTKLDGRVTNIETNMATKTDIANIQRDIERSKTDLTWRLAGLLITFSGIIGAIFFGAIQMSSP